MKIGVDYYPEQWDETLWEQDAEKMVQAGVRIVRMAEFAWSRLEPEEGVYDFDWLDRAVSLFTDQGIEVFLCTPTCTPPLWLFEKYPEVIQIDKNGQQIPIGIRGHRCMNSPVYRQLSEKVIRQMVSRYRDNPMVIGYQIDNELEANHCRCPVCQGKFRDWMEKKYADIQTVNQAYGNTVWSGEYSSFSQVMPPMGEHTQWQNPSLTLDFNRYASDSTVDYVEFQSRLIRSIDKKALITTNNWLCENMPDFYQMFEELDFVSYDNYPATKLPDSQQEIYSHAFHLDLMRGIKQKNFWIMEQLSGSVGSWMPMSPAPRPGMLKGYALQAIAHGADAVLHFRWRTAVSGAEMFWHGILDHSNIPGRRYQEFSELCETVNGLQELNGSVIQNRVALLYGSDQEYGFKLQHQTEGMYYLEQLKSLHDGFTSIGIGVDIIDENADLSGYDIILAPTLYITKENVVNNLYDFVDKGGSLVLTNRSGVKDAWNKCIMSPLPAVFSKLVGAHVTEYDPVGVQTQSVRLVDQTWKIHWKKTCQNMDSAIGRAEENSISKPERKGEVGVWETCFCTQWCDLLELDTARAVAVYGDQFYEGIPAITVNDFGRGRAYYLGTVLERKMYITLAKILAEEKQMTYIANLPLGVEITQRKREQECWSFLFNNTDKVQRFLPELVTGKASDDNLQRLVLVQEKVGSGKEVWELQPFEMQIKKCR